VFGRHQGTRASAGGGAVGILMQHLLIAYELLVIMIGLAALSIALSWVLRTGEADVRNFCILYALFTIVMVIEVLRKYLSLNVAGYSAWNWHFLTRVYMVFNRAVILAAIYFLLAAYRIKARKPLMLGAALTMVIATGMLFTPVGAVLDTDNQVIRLGAGYGIAEAWYVSAFTFVMVLGWGWLHRVWKADRRMFFIGLMIFATIGYMETVRTFLQYVHAPELTMAAQSGFLYSSIPYGLYGIFVTVYFLGFFTPASIEVDQLFEAFLSRHGITGRERDIILKVAEGKSNSAIATELYVSTATVKTHLHNIYAKIGVDSRYDLLARLRAGQ
jgi:DNA-binding CsgD family transcriptional regulator